MHPKAHHCQIGLYVDSFGHAISDLEPSFLLIVGEETVWVLQLEIASSTTLKIPLE